MIKKLLVFIPLIILLIQPAKGAGGTPFKGEKVTSQIEAKQMDKNAQILADYLARFNSPLQYSAQDFIDAAKAYDLDWRMLPAIAGVESTFGKVTPGGFNAWGWGVYDTQAIYFNSWKEGIFTIAKGLRENYLDKGFTDPYSINRIYATSPYWGWKVAYFMDDLDKFAQKYEVGNKVANVSIPQIKVAAISGLLTLNRL